ncbi:ATP/GTP-binding protein [Actinomadura fulvescens]|uniref:ATP/GTP-binding protein n=1 Tax=Actinomadura fulvescens TaxID=46160 RepID=A0ABP6CWG1_9ACTN
MTNPVHARRPGNRPPAVLKIVIAGGFGVGKTTLVGAVSEIEPLTTEEHLTVASNGIDDLAGVEAKTTTTVSMDFGRITFDQPQPLLLYLFGTPGQDRFLFTWHDLCHGALGAVVLADTRRLETSFTAIGFFEQRQLPFVVAVNQFDGAHRYPTCEIRDALHLPARIPVLRCDARDPHSAATVLITVVDLALSPTATRPLPAPRIPVQPPSPAPGA